MQHHIRDPNRDHKHGRIFRLIAKDRPLLEPVKIDGQPIDALLDLLKTYEDRVRYRVRRELAERDTDQVAAAIKTWVAGLDADAEKTDHYKLEALWVCQHHNIINKDLLNQVLNAKDARARAAATRVVCYWRKQLDNALDLLAKRAEDETPACAA